MNHKSVLKSGAVLALSIVASAPSYAQSVDPKSDGAEQLGEIVITAERRETTLQKTPLSIVAFSGAKLSEGNVQNLTDIQASVPGLQVGRVGLNGTIFLRGVGTDIINVGSDSSVAYYVDGIYRPRPRDVLGDFLDIERIEVLKGPQGTLYGRNSAGGAINIITTAPTNKVEGLVELGYGNFNTIQAAGVFNMPLEDDKLLFRAVAQYERDDGYIKNLVTTPGTLGRLNAKDLFQSRVKLRALPTDNLTIDLTAEYTRDNSVNAAYSPEATAPNLARDVFGGRVSLNPLEVYNDTTSKVNGDKWGLSARIALVASDAITLTSLTGYYNSKATESTDRDGTDVLFSPVIATDQSKSVSQEFQLNYESDGPFRFVAGATYFRETLNQDVILYGAIPSFAPPRPTFRSINIGINVDFANNAYGLYAQGTYKITDKFRITGGAHYSNENKSYTTSQATNGVAPFPIVSTFGDRKSWSSVTPLARLEYDVADDFLVYASASRGFKSGAFNTASDRLVPPLNPETVWSYEVGMKSTFFDHRLRLNAAVFHTRFKDLQVQVFRTGEQVAGVQNASAANITGLEFDSAIVISKNFSIDFGAAYLDTKYKDYVTDDPTDNLVCLTRTLSEPGCINLSGNTLARAPKFSANAGFNLGTEVKGGRLSLRGDVSYRSKQFFSPFNRSYASQPSFALANASLGWNSDDNGWQFTAFVHNIFDKIYRLNQGSSTPTVPPGNYIAPPRTYGVKVRYSF